MYHYDRAWNCRVEGVGLKSTVSGIINKNLCEKGLMKNAIRPILFIIAAVGQLLCLECDRLITYTNTGRFNFKDFEDNGRLSKVFEGTSPNRPLASMLLGIPAMAMFFCGYAGFSQWIREYSAVCANAILITSVITFFAGVVHHCVCAAVEWLYISFGKTEQARFTLYDFFKKTACTMYIYYIGLLINAVMMLLVVISGNSPLPAWCCVFNVLPLFLIFLPFKLVGTGNIAGMIMFAGLAIFGF